MTTVRPKQPHQAVLTGAFLSVLLASTAATAQHPMQDQHRMPPQTMPHTMHDMPGMPQSMAGMSEGSRQLHAAMMSGMRGGMPMHMTGNVDTDFATMMTMHDRKSVAMADVVIKYGKDRKLVDLARKMRADRLAQVRQWAPYVAPAKK
ncbi:DUF305 domain-containing protein [Cognatilysobacter lacus]|uniref:DUF305 domain-containing protein n=1 Tax=Cognatilysobacter lacus TaxID=1643323 RepID=A0A5D8Z551_9GAMM|nr:DUF305 domain-containing protein [Lysobacter lacus]TZF89807.1 DUF305 domain-containing protein [Lysobacter lacus]